MKSYLYLTISILINKNGDQNIFIVASLLMPYQNKKMDEGEEVGYEFITYTVWLIRPNFT